MSDFANSNIARSAPVTIFRRELLPNQLSCRGVVMWPAGLELLIPDVVALRVPSGDENLGALDDGNVGGL